MYEFILKKIKRQSLGLILTPSQSLSQQLCARSKYPSRILPLHNYLLNLWEQSTSSKILLTEFQEWQIWQEIIRKSNVSNTLLNIPNTAKQVQEAWTLSAEWKLPILNQSLFLTDEINQFIEWCAEFKELCQQKNWISSTQLIPELSLHRSALKLPPEFIFVNFDDLNPQTRNFFDVLSVPYSFVNSQCFEKAMPITCHPFPNFDQELKAMASWAHQIQETKPTALVHCVVPQLHQHRRMVERIFRKNFNTTLPRNLTVEIKSRHAISQSPIIKVALLILSLDSLKNPIDQVTELLLTSFIQNSETESSARAILDIYLRELNQPELTWHDFFFQAQKEQTLTLLIESLQEFLTLKTSLKNKRDSLANWAVHFQSLLDILSWPGERSLSTQEKQEQEIWGKCLNDFVCSNPEINKTYPEKKALNLLQQLLNNTLFQASNLKSNIQIMDLQEAAQLECDYRWVCGLHDENWPADPHPNPFLPHTLQIEKNLPHSTYQNEFSFAKKITQGLSQGATNIIFSFPENNEERPLKMSSLLKDFVFQSYDSLFLEESLNSDLPLIGPMGTFSHKWEKDSIHVFPTIKQKETSGGSDILKSQSACPFQAFAKYRLKTKVLPIPSPYLSNLDRGNLLHAVLDLFWGQVHNQAQLLSYNTEQLALLIQNSVNLILKSKHFILQKCPPHYLTIEKQCLESLLFIWVETERKRPYFTVTAREQKQIVSIGGLNLKLTLDRIDTLENGNQVVIDYKTGQATISKNSWIGERPEEPQLPLYCLALPALRGSIIAQLRAQKPGFTGITAEPSGIVGVDAITGEENSWQQTIEAWSNTLEQLAGQFSKGYAAVDPRDKTVCTHCDFHSLCRIDEETYN